jgi:hypothetical protein
MTKPILLLDVDGVLSVIDKTAPQRQVRLRGNSFYPIKNSRPFMLLVWRLFEVHWMTAWKAHANRIAEWAGLPERPVLLGKWGEGFEDWKAHAVSKFNTVGRRVAWIEDGIGTEAKTIVAERGWAYFHCDSFVGVTDEHIEGLTEFAKRKS